MRCDLPRDLQGAEIHIFADLHIGDRMSDFKRIVDEINYVRDTPHAYCILNGDLMDTAIAASVGDTYGANLQPMEQLKQCVALFEPIKDKILCITGGNHENRIYKQDGIDMTHLMAAQLGIPDKYTDTTALLFIRLGEHSRYNSKGRQVCYSAYVTHGGGGGRKEGGKINRLADLAGIVDADIYIHSHTHLPAVFKGAYFRVDTSNSSVSLVDKLFVNAAAKLNYGGYGDRQGYKPASKDSPVIRLDGRRKKMTATL
jgi:predicted phosphodiesterase